MIALLASINRRRSPRRTISSIEIAWDYLNRSGELGDAIVAGRFLSDTIELMVRRGERRQLMLANKAIAAYQQFRRQQSVPPVLASA